MNSLSSTGFDVCEAYDHILEDEQISPPLGAILALTELIKASDAGTMFELVKGLNEGAEALKVKNPDTISLNAGFFRNTARPIHLPLFSFINILVQSFNDLKTELVKHGENYATEALTYRSKIAELALGFIKDDSIIMTHSYSRVVMQTLVRSHARKRISVYVTEARPGGLGVKTHEELTAAGIPCTIVLDSAVAYIMDKVDVVLVGSEAVVESGGLINAVGTAQVAIIARASNKPFFALSESYKFHRLFPLSQYDLPTQGSKNILMFPLQHSLQAPTLTARPSVMPSAASSISKSPHAAKHWSGTLSMTSEQISQNPRVDYTGPELITLVFSDVGSLTPEGVSQYLVGMFAG